jgi:hypothetical protein
MHDIRFFDPLKPPSNPPSVYLHEACTQQFFAQAKPKAEETTASVPFMLTNAQRSLLKARGFTDEQISKLTPQQALTILGSAGLQTLGPEPDHPCVQCNVNDGKVYLIRDNFGPDNAVKPLHEQCAPFFFKLR